jgi:1,4-dihydroxy-2-naphthoate octaprenyltransferase
MIVLRVVVIVITALCYSRGLCLWLLAIATAVAATTTSTPRPSRDGLGSLPSIAVVGIVCHMLLLAEKGEDSSRTSTAKRFLKLFLLLHSIRTCSTGRYHFMLLSEDYVLTSAEGGCRYLQL